MKPDVIFFGETISPRVKERSYVLDFDIGSCTLSYTRSSQIRYGGPQRSLTCDWDYTSNILSLSVRFHC